MIYQTPHLDERGHTGIIKQNVSHYPEVPYCNDYAQATAVATNMNNTVINVVAVYFRPNKNLNNIFMF